jgi:hypothetical protein
LDMEKQCSDKTLSTEFASIDKNKIFSVAELQCCLSKISSSYSEFDLHLSRFQTIVGLIVPLFNCCKDDYFISVDKYTFDQMVSSCSEFSPEYLMKLLVHQNGDYVSNTNAFQPFILVGDTFETNVNLLQRFFYNYKNIILYKKKRFQIRSGFIFEEAVKEKIKNMGFCVQDFKRINRKEFDVVTIKNGVIYNFQCKNNWIEFTKIESDKKKFVRYNKSLERYYKRALVKEEKRENMLLEKLNISEIKHYVVTRFPVITKNHRIIPFNNIERLQYLS